MKFNTCPGITQKYSGTFAGINAEALLAVTTAVESIVTQRASVEAIRTCLRPKRRRSVRLCCGDL